MRQSVENLKALATDAGRMTSFDPEGSARVLLAGVNTDLENFLSQLPEEVRDEYEARYIEKVKEWLCALSRCFSSMITGPANFNTRRHENTERAERNARQRLYDWSEAVIRRLNRQSRLVGWAEVERLTAKLERLTELQEKMKAVNKIVRSKKLSEEEMVDELSALGLSKKTIALVMAEPQYTFQKKGFQQYELSNNLAKIKATEQAIARHSRMAQSEDKHYTFDGGRVEENNGEERLRIFFDEIPSAAMRATLKSNGFKWSPTNQAWQRQLTPNALRALKHYLGLENLTPEE